MRLKWAIFSAFVVVGMAGSGRAANIDNWVVLGINDLGGPSGIFTDGVLHSAINAGGSPATVNLTVNGEVIPFEPAQLLASNTNAFNFGPSFNDAAFDEIMGTHSWQGGGGSFVIPDLVPGYTYSLQILGVNDTRACCSARDTLFSDGRGIDFASPPVNRGSAHTAIAFFTADSDSQLIEVLPGLGGGGADPTLSGYVVRIQSVPEPTTAGLLALGLLGLVARHRRRG